MHQANDAVGQASNLYQVGGGGAAVNNYVGQVSSSPAKQEIDIGLLSEKHDQYIELIL